MADLNHEHTAWAARVEAARTRPTTYVATADGYDCEGGKMVKEGETFTTTAPRGSWMEPADKGGRGGKPVEVAG